MILKSGSGAFAADFTIDEPHVISRIGLCESVWFDGDTSSMFRPKVKVISKEGES